MSRRRSAVIRVAIALMVVDHLNNGAWALFNARGYYRALPGDPERDDSAMTLVIIRDLGVARLTLAALLIAAAVLLGRRLLLVAVGVAAFAGVLRLLAHAAGDSHAEWFNWIGYALGAGVPVAVAVFVWRMPVSEPDASAGHDA